MAGRSGGILGRRVVIFLLAAEFGRDVASGCASCWPDIDWTDVRGQNGFGMVFPCCRASLGLGALTENQAQEHV